MEKLKLRLDILKNSEVIDDKIQKKIEKILHFLREKWGISLTEETGGMFVTHMAMALKRVRDCESITGIDESVYEEVLTSENLGKAEEIYDSLQREVLIPALPENEEKYVLIHILSMIKNLNE